MENAADKELLQIIKLDEKSTYITIVLSRTKHEHFFFVFTTLV